MATKLLDPVKKDLGITHSKKDNDIQDAIETAKQRLSQIGVGIVSENNKTTVTAITVIKTDRRPMTRKAGRAGRTSLLPRTSPWTP